MQTTTENLLKQTTSRCLECGVKCPADVVEVVDAESSKIIMRRECPCHGEQERVISSDSRYYWLAKGNDANRSCGKGSSCCSVSGDKSGTLGSNALDEAKRGSIEQLSTCLALIEIVDSCNLACPTCFADSPVGAGGAKLKYHSFDNIVERISGVIERKGPIEIIQFSGGEPTLHPEFFRLVEWVSTNTNIDYLLINTNGVLFSKDREFVERMGELMRHHKNIQLYLQFDGPQEEGQVELRGLDLRLTRQKAIENCRRIGLPITLAMTVNPDNLAHLWSTVEYARELENVRGVSFQPMFLSGRNPSKKNVIDDYVPLNTADIILGLHFQSDGVLSLDDFTPLPCGDPNCATIGWLFRLGGQYYSPSVFGVDIPALQASLPDRVNYDIEDLKRCGCENTPLGDLMKKMEVRESNAFRIFIKPFMDVNTWDEDRIDRCCTHVIRPDGELDSFCRYYFGPEKESCC